MANKYELLFLLEASLGKNFSQSFTSADKKIKSLSKRSEDLNAEAGKIEGLLKLRKETGELYSKMVRQKQAVEGLRASMSKMKEPSATLVKILAQEERALDKTQKAYDKKRHTLKEANLSLANYGRSTQDLIKKQEQLAKGARQSTHMLSVLTELKEKMLRKDAKIKAVGDSAVQSAVAITTIGQDVVRALNAPVRSAMEMEDAMADINKVVDFDDPKGLANMQASLERLSLTIPMTATELARIAAAAGQAGIAKNDLISFTEQAAKMGVAFDISAEEAGEMMAKWRSGMNLTQQEVLELANATNALSNSNAAQAKQIGEVLKRYGALGKVAGLSEKQTAALAATAISAGAEAEVAATGINAVMRSLVKGASMTDLQGAAFTNLGFDPKQLQRDVQSDAPKAILSVLNSIKVKVPRELQSQYLTAMFGEEGARAIGPMLSNIDLLKRNFELVSQPAQYAGSMISEFESRIKTTSSSLDIAKNTLTYISTAIGGTLLEPLKDAAIAFARVGKAIGDWLKANQEVVGIGAKTIILITSLALAFHAVRAVIFFAFMPLLHFQKILISLKAIMASSAVATTAWAATCKGATLATKGLAVGVKALGVAMRFAMTNPIGIAISAVVALVAAGVYLYKNWDSVKEKLRGTWQSIAESSKKPINAMISMVNLVIEAINTLCSFKVPDWVPQFGGESFSLNLPKVPQLANGGIATGATLAMVGEGAEPEAIMPLSRLASMMRLGQSTDPTISVNFAPTINISGQLTDAYSQVKRGLLEGRADLEAELERLLNQRRRLSFA